MHLIKKSKLYGQPTREIRDYFRFVGLGTFDAEDLRKSFRLSADEVQAVLSGLLADSYIDNAPARDVDVPKTSDDLKRIKKIVREKSVEEVEKLFVQETLRRNDSNVTRSAEETGMQRSNFQALMKKYNIRVRDTEFDSDEA